MIVLLLIDGLGYEYLPNNSFWKKYSTKIQNVVPTITSPNWSTILSSLDPSEHKVMDNKSHSKKNYKFPYETIFTDILKLRYMYKQEKHSLLLSDWLMMRKFCYGHDDINTNQNHLICDFKYNNVWNNLFKQLKKPSHYSLIVMNYSRLDTVAHIHGWGSPAYYKTLEYIEKQTKRVYQLLSETQKEFVLLGVSDHGGEKDDHEDHHSKKVRNVPFLFLNQNGKKQKPRLKSTKEIRKLIQDLMS
jgi:predicted AlkP superfamily pyrophosphatase or phosphodiesterase